MLNQFRTPGLKINLTEGQVGSASVPTEIQLLRVGTFYDERYGEVKITPTILASMKKNFDAKVRGIDLAIDYMHASEDIAAAWIRDVDLRNNGTELWAIPDWTPNGQRVLADKEFRYLSADFTLEYQDNESLTKYGPTLLGAGLTNRPVVKRMAPAVALTEVTEQERKLHMKTNEELQAEITALTTEITSLKASQKTFSEALGEKTPEQVKAELADLQAKNTALEADKKSAEEAKALAEKDAKFAKLMSEGKAVAAQKDAFMAGDMVKFSELAMPVKLGEQGSGNQGKSPEPKDKAEAEDRVLELAQAKVKADPKLSIGKAIDMVMSEEKELAAKAR